MSLLPVHGEKVAGRPDEGPIGGQPSTAAFIIACPPPCPLNFLALPTCGKLVLRNDAGCRLFFESLDEFRNQPLPPAADIS
ncbi:hypothetical protein [Rhizobium giardinii]|uniref:Uncharacterized protein n=1 Tax=Rhizobium giardinii TaxID=56731 RepID=A0A7W8U5W7_9HYPH|nr:hypothetical protein [Rhizobium giardinii]MBB5533410.1 hypothetical protein [Rhizobium giardinii]